MRVFAENFWHSDGWTPRNEALMGAMMKQARTARHPMPSCIQKISRRAHGTKAGPCSLRRQEKEFSLAGRQSKSAGEAC